MLVIRKRGLLEFWQPSVSWLGQWLHGTSCDNSLRCAFLISCIFPENYFKKEKNMHMSFDPTFPLLVIYFIYISVCE